MRAATITRKTAETDIAVSLTLDGTGQSRAATGVGFFDHMLDQLAKHALFDLDISAKGDLQHLREAKPPDSRDDLTGCTAIKGGGE